MSRGLAVLALCALTAGCQGGDADSATPAVTDTAPAMDSMPAVTDDAQEWPEAGPVSIRRTRSADLTGDGSPEEIIATAEGPAYDSLDVAITISGAGGDTLWRETWPSLLYFKYDGLEGKADSTVRRIVIDHIEELVAQDRVTMGGGLPAALSQGGDRDDMMREAIRYHLAELDYRRGANLTPADPTPPDAHSSIDAASVSDVRVNAVRTDVQHRPSFTYFAGGEATYVIAWSDQENAFVRIFSCC